MTTPPAGYYDDPTRPGRHRWWDGTAWAPLDALGATFSSLSTVVESMSVSVPPGYYEHPAHPGSVTWWDGTAWSDIAVVHGTLSCEVVDVELARQSAGFGVAAPRRGVYVDPDDADHLRWWDGAAWERASVAAGSALLSIDGRTGTQAHVTGLAGPRNQAARGPASAGHRHARHPSGLRDAMRRVLPVAATAVLTLAGACALAHAVLR